MFKPPRVDRVDRVDFQRVKVQPDVVVWWR